MGILNVTPDSFSDGGKFNHLDQALKHALQMQQDGAEVIDIGGESTRPGAKAVSVDEELSRVIPIIERIRQHTDVCISIDTSKTEVMREAINAGADMVNDVNALLSENAMSVCADAAVPVCLMHRQGTAKTMQINPQYRDVVVDIRTFFLERVRQCQKMGISPQNIVLDPGFGFGKTLENNLSLLREMQKFCELGFPVLVGVSRKSMFGQLLHREVDERLIGSVSAAVLAYQQGARFFRVHDVAETCDALKLCEALNG